MDDVLEAIGDYLTEVFEGCALEDWEFTGDPSPSYIFELTWGADSYLVRFTTHFLHEFTPDNIADALEKYGVIRWMQENINTMIRVGTQGIFIGENDVDEL